MFDENFPYTRERYENSPLGGAVETGLPGLTFAVGRSHTAQMTYIKNNNYHNPPAGSVAGNWPIVMSYGFFGRLILEPVLLAKFEAPKLGKYS